MRTVAKFQLECPASEASGDDVVTVIKRWGEGKFKWADDGSVTIYRSNVPVIFDQHSEHIEGLSLTSFNVLEPVGGGDLLTTIRILDGPKRISFQCTLGVASDRIAPPAISIRSPRFIREIIKLGHQWVVGNTQERVFDHSFSVARHEVDSLLELLLSADRKLPVVVVSELSGETLVGDLHERIGANVCGLAHTVRLSAEASWELTRRLGREWSCFNGAVRLFWPFRASQGDSRAHPLWTLDRIISRAETEAAARDNFVSDITGRLIEASTFMADDPHFLEFETGRSRQATETARATAADSGDFEKLAEAYAAENESLLRRVIDQEHEIAALRQNVEALTIALRSVPTEGRDAVAELPPETVAEAIAIARRELDKSLGIAHESEPDWLKLNEAAGPPEKILRYLRTLATLSDQLANGSPLGVNIPIWLRQRGVECSIDSRTGRDNRSDRNFRDRLVNGESVECKFHAKPADGTSPDMCVRIYFGVSEQRPKVRVGYIGRHPD